MLLDQIDFFDAEFDADQLRLIDQTKANFLAAQPTLLDEATPYLWEYYRDTVKEFGPELAREYGIAPLEPSADIWTQVSMTVPPSISLGRAPFSPAPAYLSFEGEVSWEREHGLQLVLESGSRVCKVGPYDGHSTVAHAHGNLALLGDIYRR